MQLRNKGFLGFLTNSLCQNQSLFNFCLSSTFHNKHQQTATQFGTKQLNIQQSTIYTSQQKVRTMATTAASIKYLTQDEAINLDRELFDDYAFSVDQLMELAGLSCAQAIAKTYPRAQYDKPIICCGPGNNGGDGLVCARHLKLFGYNPTVICPKPGRGQLYQNLLTQCKKFQITILDQVPLQQQQKHHPFEKLGNLIVDSVFGFSFKPPNRNPDFAKLLNLMHSSSSASKRSVKLPLISIDIPSGWHIETGDTNIEEDQIDVEETMKIPALQPDCLISLTAPKMCARNFKGKHHYLGGRFCPKSIQDKYKLNLPEYPGTEGIITLT